jgi:hypothetical protein
VAAREVIRHIEAKRFPQAFKCALDGVAYCETHRSRFDFQRLYWWVFLEHAARSANELGDDERRRVAARLGDAPGPGGMLEAHCLDLLSRWRWRAHDADGAIDLARRAVLADPTRPDGHAARLVRLADREVRSVAAAPRGGAHLCQRP